MVVSTPLPANNGPAHDNEKRRKQTMERARANHLSRQLQMRLQYARLKVDHGWQKQNLNEVENLYFHHSHQRGSKASPTIAPANLNVLLSSASPSTSTGTHSHVIDSPGQSKPSKPPSPLTQSYTIASPPRNPQDDNQTSSSASSFQFASTSSQSSGQQQLSPAISINPSTINNLIHMAPKPESKLLSAPTPPAHYASAGPSYISTYSPTNFFVTDVHFRNDHPSQLPSPTPVATTWAITNPRPPLPASSSSPYPAAPLSRQPTLPVSPGTATNENPYGFPPASLTYDSFWSSHSSSATRSFRSSLGSLTAASSVSGIDTSSASSTFVPKPYHAEVSRPTIEASAAVGRE